MITKRIIVAFVFTMGIIAVANAQSEKDTVKVVYDIPVPGEEYEVEDDHYFGDYDIDDKKMPVDSCLLQNSQAFARQRCGSFGDVRYVSLCKAVEGGAGNDSWIDIKVAQCLTSVDSLNKRRLITWLPKEYYDDGRKIWVEWSYSVAVPFSVKDLYDAGPGYDNLIYVVDSTSFFLIGKIRKDKRKTTRDEKLTRQKIGCDAKVYSAVIGCGFFLFCNIPKKDMDMVCSSFMTLVNNKVVDWDY